MLINIIWSRDKWLGPLTYDHLGHMVPDKQWLSWLHPICSCPQTSASPPGGAERLLEGDSALGREDDGGEKQREHCSPHVLNTSPRLGLMPDSGCFAVQHQPSAQDPTTKISECSLGILFYALPSSL